MLKIEHVDNCTSDNQTTLSEIITDNEGNFYVTKIYRSGLENINFEKINKNYKIDSNHVTNKHFIYSQISSFLKQKELFYLK